MFKMIKNLLRKNNCNDLINAEYPKINVNFFYTTQACPYCGVIFEKIPARKKRCKNCKNTFYKRTLYNPCTKIFLKEDDLVKHDEYIKEYGIKQDVKRRLKYVIEAFNNRCIGKILINEELKYTKNFNENDIGSLRNIYSFYTYNNLLKDDWIESIFYISRVLYLDYVQDIEIDKNFIIYDYWMKLLNFLLYKNNIKLPSKDFIYFFIKANDNLYSLLKNINVKTIHPSAVWYYIENEIIKKGS